VLSHVLSQEQRGVSRIDKLIDLFLREPPEVRVEDVRKVLDTLGYKECRGGKHVHVFRNDRGVKLSIPTVRGRIVKRTYARKIVRLIEEAERDG
jgi:predicted RNA binding protein YcfA (HicA-like mRNA interferase family)